MVVATAPAPLRNRAPRVLFASPHLPLPKAGVEEDDVDFFYYRNTLAQGVFQLRQMASWHPLHYLAQNLPVDSVVLENPTWEAFTREVERGRYDVVALTFTVILAGRVLRMVRWLKEHHPGIQVVLGGHGTVLADEDLEVGRELAARADAVCRGDGLEFMRGYLRDRWEVEATCGPVRQELVPTKFSLFRSRLPLFEQLNLVRSFGCATGCSFCASSAYFGRRKIVALSGARLYEALRRCAASHPRARSALILDEDFLADRADVLEFMARMEQDAALRDRPVLLTVFASIRSLSRYDVSELVRCGIGTVFVGVESFRDELLAGETLAKRRGEDVAATFERLHAAGIATIGSMILGWDGHTPANVREEMQRFVALNPTFYQVVPLHPVPGTPLWKRIVAEGRLVPGYRPEEDGVARTNFAFRHFGPTEVHALAGETYRALAAEGGPWPFRSFEIYLQGWRNLSGREDPALVARGHAMRKMALTVLPLALASVALASGAGFRRRWRAVFTDFARTQKAAMALGVLGALAALPVLGLVRTWGWLRQTLTRHGDQPDSLRREYRQSV